MCCLQHSKLANQACYPCVTVPSGFSSTGSPTNFHIFGRPFKDSEALALAMAYQETAMFHSVTPTIPIPSDASKL
jgi:Asp-tRNA(Asn)/Glu-tRNA(Gln) amidotransferase A subunit family amidase